MLVQILPLTGGLIFSHIAGLLKFHKGLLNLFTMLGDFRLQVADQELGDGFRNAGRPGDFLKEPEDFENTGGFNGCVSNSFI